MISISIHSSVQLVSIYALFLGVEFSLKNLICVKKLTFRNSAIIAWHVPRHVHALIVRPHHHQPMDLFNVFSLCGTFRTDDSTQSQSALMSLLNLLHH